MRPAHQEDTGAGGHDSFLDIVANIVGILIILVMVAGVRAKNWPAKVVEDEGIRTAAALLDEDQATELSLRRDVLMAQGQLRRLELEAAAQYNKRALLATLVAAWQKKIELARSQLDADSQAEFDVRRGLSEASSDLQRMRRQQALAEAAETEPIVVESYPTPLSKTVDEDEIHFQLKSGRVVFIPLEKLLESFKQDAQRKAYKLFDLPELTDTVGPVGGFRLRYTLKRYDVPLETQAATGRGGSFARLNCWTLIPVSGELGEPVEQALADGSQFRRVLSGFRPGKTTITIWTYPDSFGEFRRLKEQLYQLGFVTAARPLPDGVPIGGSPQGTKSAAE